MFLIYFSNNRNPRRHLEPLQLQTEISSQRGRGDYTMVFAIDGIIQLPLVHTRGARRRSTGVVAFLRPNGDRV